MNQAKIEKNIDNALEEIKKHIPEAYSSTFAIFQPTQKGIAFGLGFIGNITTRMLVETCVSIVEKIAEDKKTHPAMVLLDITERIMERSRERDEAEEGSKAEKKPEKENVDS